MPVPTLDLARTADAPVLSLALPSSAPELPDAESSPTELAISAGLQGPLLELNPIESWAESPDIAFRPPSKRTLVVAGSVIAAILLLAGGGLFIQDWRSQPKHCGSSDAISKLDPFIQDALRPLRAAFTNTATTSVLEGLRWTVSDATEHAEDKERHLRQCSGHVYFAFPPELKDFLEKAAAKDQTIMAPLTYEAIVRLTKDRVRRGEIPGTAEDMSLHGARIMEQLVSGAATIEGQSGIDTRKQKVTETLESIRLLASDPLLIEQLSILAFKYNINPVSAMQGEINTKWSGVSSIQSGKELDFPIRYVTAYVEDGGDNKHRVMAMFGSEQELAGLARIVEMYSAWSEAKKAMPLAMSRKEPVSVTSSHPPVPAAEPPAAKLAAPAMAPVAAPTHTTPTTTAAPTSPAPEKPVARMHAPAPVAASKPTASSTVTAPKPPTVTAAPDTQSSSREAAKSATQVPQEDQVPKPAAPAVQAEKPSPVAPPVAKTADQLYAEREGPECKRATVRAFCQLNLKAKLCADLNAYGTAGGTICPPSKPQPASGGIIGGNG